MCGCTRDLVPPCAAPGPGLLGLPHGKALTRQVTGSVWPQQPRVGTSSGRSLSASCGAGASGPGSGRGQADARVLSSRGVCCEHLWVLFKRLVPLWETLQIPALPPPLSPCPSTFSWGLLLGCWSALGVRGFSSGVPAPWQCRGSPGWPAALLNAIVYSSHELLRDGGFHSPRSPTPRTWASSALGDRSVQSGP